MKTVAPFYLTCRVLSASLCLISALSVVAEDVFIHSTAGSGWPGGPMGMSGRPSFGRIDIDCDVNYDGVITNDGSDSGDLERNPPGLVIGAERMGKILFRVTPLTAPADMRDKEPEIDIDKLVARLEVRPINMLRRDGLFLKVEDETKAGHIKIWADVKRSKLLLDSADTGKRRVDWNLCANEAPAAVFVEYVASAEATALCLVTLEIDDVSRKGYKEGKHNKLAARDYVLITPKREGVAVEPSSEVSENAGRRAQGFGNYAGFAKTDRDTENVWVPKS